MQRMATGGIVAFEEGGEVPGYDKGGTTQAIDYRQAIIDEAQLQGVPAAVALQISGVESGFNPNARPIDPKTGKPRSSATSFFQVIDKTFKDLGGDPNKRTDPMENIRVGVKSLAQNQAALTKTLGREPKPQELYTTHFLGTETGSKLLTADAAMPIGKFLASADPKNKDKIIAANPEVLGGKKTVGDVLSWADKKMLPVIAGGAAVAAAPTDAAVAAAPKDEGLASLIPGQTAKAPPKAPQGGFLSPDSFQRGAAAIGLPQDVGRQAYTTLMAPTPLAPASMVPKSGPGILGGLEKLGEKLYGKVAPGKGMTEAQIAAAKAEMAAAARTGGPDQLLLTGPQAKLPGPTTPVTPAGQGITDLVAPGARMVPVAEDASRLEKMAQASNLEKLRKAQEGVGEGAAATQPAQTAARFAQEAGPASAAEKIQAASIAREAEHAAQVGAAASQGQAAKTGLATLAAGATAVGNMGDGSNVITGATPVPFREFGEDTGQMPAEPPSPKEIKEIGKEATPKGERKGMSGEDFLMIGLGILSGQSPHAMVNIGEGGLKGLQMSQAARKIASEEAYHKGMLERYATPQELQMAMAYNDPEKRKAIEGYAKMQAQIKNEPMTKQKLFQEFMKSPAGQIGDYDKFDTYMQQWENRFGPIGGGLPKGTSVTRIG
jgi:hypothetical protein